MNITLMAHDKKKEKKKRLSHLTRKKYSFYCIDHSEIFMGMIERLHATVLTYL